MQGERAATVFTDLKPIREACSPTAVDKLDTFRTKRAMRPFLCSCTVARLYVPARWRAGLAGRGKELRLNEVLCRQSTA